MKQFLLSSLLLCALLLGAGACNNDDAEVMGPPLTDVNATYEKETLELTYGGGLLAGSDRQITFHSEDKQTAKISLQNVLPGIDNLELSEVLLTSSKDETQFLFKGASDKDQCQLDYSGYVEKGKLVLNLKANISANSAVAGRWALQSIVSENKVYKKQPTLFSWETTADFPGFDITSSEGFDLSLSSNEAAKNIAKGLSDYMIATNLIKEVTLKSDGNLVVVYAKEVNDSDPVWQESGINDLHYYIRDNRFYLLVNTNAFSVGGDDNVLRGWIGMLLQQYSSGVPLGFNSAESGKLSVYLDKEVLGSKSFTSMMSLFSTLLPEKSDYIPISLMRNVFSNYSTAIKETTAIQLGLNFSTVKQGA